jgi:hypothetical protein
MISGSYTVDITMGAAFTQPEKVQAVIGKHGENLRGPFIVTLDESGKYAPLKFPQSAESSEAEPFIHYTQRIVVAGEPSFDIAAKAAASRPAASPEKHCSPQATGKGLRPTTARSLRSTLALWIAGTRARDAAVATI